MVRNLGLAAGSLAGFLLARRLTRRPLDLRGRSVLITGGSRGLGLLMAREFAAHGCRIAICARDVVELERAREDLQSGGAEVLALPCDVTSQLQVEELVRDVESAFGGIDVLVNNAGIIQGGPVSAMTAGDFVREMETNFFGALYATMAALPAMRERGDGRIVNITSIGGRVSVPHLMPYNCSKFAFFGFSQGMRAELARDGITVSTIVPGLMRTGSPVNALFKGQARKEYALFALMDSTPLTSMDARRAARRIVEATRHGEAVVTLTWQAKLIGTAHDLFPGAVADLFGLANRFLPSADGAGAGEVRGMDLDLPSALEPFVAMTKRAALRNNEFGGSHAPSPEHVRRVGLDEDS